MRKSDGIRLHVRGQDSSRSTNRDWLGTPVPTEPGIVGNGPTPEEIDRLFGWALDALVGDVEDMPEDAAVRGAA